MKKKTAAARQRWDVGENLKASRKSLAIARGFLGDVINGVKPLQSCRAALTYFRRAAEVNARAGAGRVRLGPGGQTAGAGAGAEIALRQFEKRYLRACVVGERDTRHDFDMTREDVARELAGYGKKKRR
jgi:hypothetical protein